LLIFPPGVLIIQWGSCDGDKFLRFYTASRNYHIEVAVHIDPAPLHAHHSYRSESAGLAVADFIV